MTVLVPKNQFISEVKVKNTQQFLKKLSGFFQGGSTRKTPGGFFQVGPLRRTLEVLPSYAAYR